MSSSITVITLGTAASSIFLSASLSLLWGLIDNQQILTHLPLFEELKFPSNTVIYNKIILQIAQLDLIPTKQIDETVFQNKDRERVAFGIKMAEYEYDSTLFIDNVGSFFWLIVFYLLTNFFALLEPNLNSRFWSNSGQFFPHKSKIFQPTSY